MDTNPLTEDQAAVQAELSEESRLNLSTDQGNLPMTPFSYTSVPLQGNCRWFVRRGDTVKYERGFRSKLDASNWINAFGERLDWRAGFTFKLKGDTIHMEIASRQGDVAKA
ncbi:TPA: hypothetical protein ACGW3M_001071 [Pseudomonas aeruginosa]|uniref:hypothetical protein n=1 Tax=Pseudomonas aeruginosa TaxID=287 RepID=UPI0027F66B48|nr:hypothetical protein [Pseudomonas aeruginosa]ELJ2276113.1 hypothetical protein [Pseudomonas aeruginosa]MBX6653810.1 hypothetical protein [Pseudomonas aeruginosa]